MTRRGEQQSTYGSCPQIPSAQHPTEASRSLSCKLPVKTCSNHSKAWDERETRTLTHFEKSLPEFSISFPGKTFKKISIVFQPYVWVTSSWKIRYFFCIMSILYFYGTFSCVPLSEPVWTASNAPLHHQAPLHPMYIGKIPAVWTILHNRSLERVS